MIGKIQSDPELEEELYRLNFDIRKNGVKVPGDSYVMDEETDARIELNQMNWNGLRTLPKNPLSANTCLR